VGLRGVVGAERGRGVGTAVVLPVEGPAKELLRQVRVSLRHAGAGREQRHALSVHQRGVGEAEAPVDERFYLCREEEAVDGGGHDDGIGSDHLLEDLPCVILLDAARLALVCHACEAAEASAYRVVGDVQLLHLVPAGSRFLLKGPERGSGLAVFLGSAKDCQYFHVNRSLWSLHVMALYRWLSIRAPHDEA